MRNDPTHLAQLFAVFVDFRRPGWVFCGAYGFLIIYSDRTPSDPSKTVTKQRNRRLLLAPDEHAVGLIQILHGCAFGQEP